MKINYRYRVIYLRFIGTHSDYDRINAESIIRKLNRELGIPADVLIQDYARGQPRAKEPA